MDILSLTSHVFRRCLPDVKLSLQSTAGVAICFIRQATEAGTEHISFTGPLSDDCILPL